VFEIDRVLIPPGSPDDDPRDTPPSSRRAFRRSIAESIRTECAARPPSYRPRRDVLDDFDSD